MMKKFVALVFFLSACSSGVPDVAKPPLGEATASDLQGSALALVGTGNDAHNVSDACARALALAKPLAQGARLSAFRLFNAYPPAAQVISPGEASALDAAGSVPDLMACLPEGMLEFSVMVDGVLMKGTKKDLHPLAVFQDPDGAYIAAYLHKSYEVDDGEGEAVEISGVILGSSGRIVGGMRELSSWYEYEGSIRIRDFVYRNGRAITTEQVYDPASTDELGNPLSYVDVGGARVLREHRFDAPND